MPKFNGLTDDQWALLAPLMPPEPARKRAGMPRNDYRHSLNSIFWVMLSGARWCDLPEREDFASRTAANRWLIRWRHNGTLERIFSGLRDLGRLSGQFDWERLSVDGSFSPVQRPWQRRGFRPQGQGPYRASGGG
jgi:transposase